jgi:heme-degrading monooxygenase HmoA
MSVLMTLQVSGDVAKLEQLAAEDLGQFKKVVGRAKEHGVLHHRFWHGNGEILVVDEWETEQGFHDFFAASPEIATIMERAGVTTQPKITFWKPVAVDDAI